MRVTCISLSSSLWCPCETTNKTRWHLYVPWWFSYTIWCYTRPQLAHDDNIGLRSWKPGKSKQNLHVHPYIKAENTFLSSLTSLVAWSRVKEHFFQKWGGNNVPHNSFPSFPFLCTWFDFTHPWLHVVLLMVHQPHTHQSHAMPLLGRQKRPRYVGDDRLIYDGSFSDS